MQSAGLLGLLHAVALVELIMPDLAINALNATPTKLESLSRAQSSAQRAAMTIIKDSKNKCNTFLILFLHINIALCHYILNKK